MFYNDYIDIYEDNNREQQLSDLERYVYNDDENNDNNDIVDNNNKKSLIIKIELGENNDSTEAENNTENKNKSEIESNLVETPKNNELTNENETNNLKNEDNQVLKKKRGRATKKENKEEAHTKYSDDNVRRKCKHIVIQNIMNFINQKISEKVVNIGKGMFIKKLLIINQTQIADATIKFNRLFLLKTLSEIFSEDISKRYTNYLPDHNKYVISSLINHQDENVKNYFIKLFNLKFIDCLKHFRGSIIIPELSGMTPFNELDIKSESDEDYYQVLSYYMMNYEIVLTNKRKRKEIMNN